MPWAAILASGVVGGASIALWYFGQKFTRRYVAMTGVMPPLTWMFRRTTDSELEGFRRRALAFLPFYLVAVAIILIRP